MDKGRRESKRGNRKTEEKYHSDSDSGSSSKYTSDSDSDYELTIMTPQQRLKEAIRSKKDDRKKGVYKEKENYDE